MEPATIALISLAVTSACVLILEVFKICNDKHHFITSIGNSCCSVKDK